MPRRRSAAAAGRTEDGVDVQLVRAGSVRVTAPSESLLASVQAQAQGAGAQGVMPVTKLLRKGKAVLSGLRPGAGKIVLNPGEGAARPEPQVVQVVAGETVEVTFQ